MNSANFGLSEGCIRELYSLNRCLSKQPTLQIIDFEQSQANEKEITIRISDGFHFVDCTLSGNYQITNDCICQTKNATTITYFKRLHIVRLVDYFSKLDQTRICKLKIIIRKMNEIVLGNDIQGAPQEIQQFMLNNKQIYQKPQIKDTTLKKVPKKEGEGRNQTNQSNYIKLQNVMDVQNTNNTTGPYLYYSQPNIPYTTNLSITPSATQQISSSNSSSAIKTAKKQVSIPSSDVQTPGMGQPLTLQEIMSGKQGFLIGRLIRYKHSRRETKDGHMTVCYLGILDKYGQLVRIHLAGRLAMNNEKILKLNKCYYIRGFDLVTVKGTGIQIRLKDKEYKVLQIHNEELTRNLNSSYFKWDHQSEQENEYIDVIGMVDDIEQKTNYNPNNPSDKSVIRVVIRNKYKSIRISFWTDQMKNLQSFNLKRNEWIIIEDVRKKQSKYYDYGNESNLIRLSQYPQLIEQYSDVLPQIIEEPEPQNIKELSQLFQKDPNNSKLRFIQALFTDCKQKKIVYRLCQECKKKVEKNATECHECGSENLVFKYNCPLKFSDCTGSIVVVLFDNVASKLIGKTANEVSQCSEQELQQILEPLYYKTYLLTIQNRNQRLIMKSVDPLTQTQQILQTKMNIQKIKQEIYPTDIWPNGFHS